MGGTEAVILGVFQLEAGVTSAGKWKDRLGIPDFSVLPASERPFQKPSTDCMTIMTHTTMKQEVVSLCNDR